MKRFLHRVLPLMLALAMVFALAACGDQAGEPSNSQTPNDSQAPSNSQNPGDSQQPAGDGDVTIRITWWGGESRHTYTQQLLDLYTQSHPNVHFEASPSGWDGYFDKLSTQAASGGMPDIIQMDYLYITTYANNGTLADLTPYIQSGAIDTSNIDDSMVNSGKIGDIQAGFPLSSSLLAVGYNPSVLAQAGVETPTSDWTWEDWISINQQIKDKTGLLGNCMGPVEDTNIFNYWVRQHGGQLFSDDKCSLGYDDDSITAGYFQMWKDMMDAGSAPNPDEYSQISTLGLEATPVVTNEAGFDLRWNNYTMNVAKVNDTLEMVTPPMLKDGEKGLWLKPGMFFSVAESSTVKDACAEFINWFVNSEEANDLMAAERGTPVSSAIREHMISSGNMSKQQEQMFAYVDEATKLCGDTPAPDPEGISEVNKVFKDCAYKAFYGTSTADEAAAEFRQMANEILERNNKK